MSDERKVDKVARKALASDVVTGAYIIDIAGMEGDLPPPLVIKLNYGQNIDT